MSRPKRACGLKAWAKSLSPARRTFSVRRFTFATDELTPISGAELIGVGERNRSVAATKMNERSSRSHSLFMITIDQKNLDDGSTKVHLRGNGSKNYV